MTTTWKFILLFPNFQSFDRLSVTPHQPSLSLGYLAAMLDKHQIPFQVLDAAAENLSTQEILERVGQFKPDYIGITTNVSIAYASVYTALKIKISFPQIKIVMGGPWATAQYEEIIQHHYADIVVLGEGEYTIVDIGRTDPKDVKSLEKIEGICYNTSNGLYKTHPRNQIQNLDEIPFPKWEYFPKERYTRSARIKPMYPFITSRGCPYNCLNCTKIVHGFRMRYRSIENMVAELDYLKRLGAREIAIEDDMFNLDLNRIKKLLFEIIKRNYKFRIQLSNGIRADHIDPVFARLLYAAGTYHVALGIESGSQKVVDFLCKGLNLAVLPRSVETLQNAHLKVAGYFIMGLPVETFQSLIHTIDFANRIKLDQVIFLTLVVFPGTRLFEFIATHTNYSSKGLIMGKLLNYQYAPMQFTTKELKPNVIRRVKAYYFIRCFVNPRRFVQYIASFTIKEFIWQMYRNVKIFLKRMVK